MRSEPVKVKVAIVGGGICGLALAAGLCKIPTLDVHVYEAVSEYKGTSHRHTQLYRVTPANTYYFDSQMSAQA